MGRKQLYVYVPERTDPKGKVHPAHIVDNSGDIPIICPVFRGNDGGLRYERSNGTIGYVSNIVGAPSEGRPKGRARKASPVEEIEDVNNDTIGSVPEVAAAAPSPVKARGRPRKAPPVQEIPDIKHADEAPIPAKARGRPRKTPPVQEIPDIKYEINTDKAPAKARGRPRKTPPVLNIKYEIKTGIDYNHDNDNDDDDYGYDDGRISREY